MNDPTAGAAALSDNELERLDTLLETHAVPHDGMSLEMLDGFLSAVTVSPEPIEPGEYLPIIWNHAPSWATAAEAEDAQQLILGLRHDIGSRLQIELDEADPDSYAAAMPLLAWPPIADGDPERGDSENDPFGTAPSDFPLGAAWALGFLRGVGLRQEAWERWASEHDFVEDDLAMLEALALFDPEQADELGLDPDDIPELSERLDLVADLPAMMADLNALRLGLIGKPARREDVPGRNDPCPCGSGKKFKKCCGAPHSLH